MQGNKVISFHFYDEEDSKHSIIGTWKWKIKTTKFIDYFKSA